MWLSTPGTASRLACPARQELLSSHCAERPASHDERLPPSATGEDHERRAAPVASQHQRRRFGGVQALQDVSFEVLPGEVQCLAGENGSGKSTLIKVITGVYQPAPGARDRLFDGKTDRRTCRRRRRARRGVEVIWQDLALFPEMTVAENIAFERSSAARRGWSNMPAMREMARELLARLGVELDVDAPLQHASPSPSARSWPSPARWSARRRLIFMDEPTASLTQSETDQSARHRAHAFGRRHRRRLRQPPAGGGAGDFEPRHRAARRQAGRRLSRPPGMTQSRLTELMTGKTFDQTRRAPATAAHAPVVLEVEGLTRARRLSRTSR